MLKWRSKISWFSREWKQMCRRTRPSAVLCPLTRPVNFWRPSNTPVRRSGTHTPHSYDLRMSIGSKPVNDLPPTTPSFWPTPSSYTYRRPAGSTRLWLRSENSRRAAISRYSARVMRKATPGQHANCRPTIARLSSRVSFTIHRLKWRRVIYGHDTIAILWV